jgi:hypothetical protein
MSPQGEKCPQVIYSQYYNISNYDMNVRKNQIKVFPNSINMLCQRVGGYVASYSILSITWNVTKVGVISTMDQGMWGWVRNERLQGLEVGEVIKIEVTYELRSDESNLNFTSSTELRMIESDFTLKF